MFVGIGNLVSWLDKKFNGAGSKGLDKAVEIMYIIIIEIKLSFEKFLSKYSPNRPTRLSNTVYGPIIFPIKQSIIKPKIAPNSAPIFFPTKRPISKTIPTNKFGATPLIVNHEKRLTCKKYVIMNDKIIIIIALNFFKNLLLCL